MPSAQQSFNRNKIAVDYVINLFGEGCTRVGQETGYNIETPEGFKVRICSAFPRERKTSKTIRFTLTEKSLKESSHLCIVEMSAEGKPVDGKIIPISEVRNACKFTPLPDGKSYSMSVSYERVKEMQSIIAFRTRDQKVIYIKEGNSDHTHAYVIIPDQDSEVSGNWSVAEFKCLICGKTRKLAGALK